MQGVPRTGGGLGAPDAGCVLRGYKLQLTIDANLKSQLETARNLLRHTHPSGDLALILSRALQLLIADLLRQRFGVGKRRKGTPTPQKSPAGQGV